MKSNQKKWIYWNTEINKNDVDLVGKKCAHLGELTRAGFRVPQGFALSLEAYDKFLNSTGAKEEINSYLKNFSVDPNDPAGFKEYEDASVAIRSIVESKTMPPEMENTILDYYRELCIKIGVNDLPVATRSAGPLSHPGQYETYLHVKGQSALIQNIIKVWSSTFNTRSLIARSKAGLPLSYDPIGVAVLQMVNAKTAGVIFTLNPINGDKSKIIIEGNWGLGESVVSGSVTPDEWMVDKIMFEIVKRKVSIKKTEYVADQLSGEVTVVDIPLDRQKIPCLTDEEVIELAKEAKKIERHFGISQDIEWVIDKDLPFPQNIFFVQSRPETIWSTKKENAKLKTRGSVTDDIINFYINIKA